MYKYKYIFFFLNYLCLLNWECNKIKPLRLNLLKQFLLFSFTNIHLKQTFSRILSSF